MFARARMRSAVSHCNGDSATRQRFAIWRGPGAILIHAAVLSKLGLNLSIFLLMPTSRSRYALARDVPDSRDYVYAPTAARLSKKPPSRVDLRRGCPRVLNQGSLGTCTAHAVAAAFGFEQRRQKIRVTTASRLFIFYNERAMTHQRSLQCVVRLRDAIKAVAKIGVCPETLWPYSEDASCCGRDLQGRHSRRLRSTRSSDTIAFRLEREAKGLSQALETLPCRRVSFPFWFRALREFREQSGEKNWNHARPAQETR